MDFHFGQSVGTVTTALVFLRLSLAPIVLHPSACTECAPNIQFLADEYIFVLLTTA
jgi:hypothetical protein